MGCSISTALQKEREILVYRLLFFGNLYQDLTEFVVTDLGHVRYESYKIRKKEEYTFRLIELNDAFYQTVEGRSVNEIDSNAPGNDRGQRKKPSNFAAKR